MVLRIACVAALALLSCPRGGTLGVVTRLESHFDEGGLAVEFIDDTGPRDARWVLEACCSHSIATVPSPDEPGYAVRFEQRCEDAPVSNGKRAEFKRRLGRLLGRTQTYSYRVLLPEGWQGGRTADPVTLTQWHELPDFDLGETWRESPLALEVLEGQWAVSTSYDPEPKSDPETILENQRRHRLGPIDADVGRWVEWRYRVHWSPDAEGSLEVWKDGERVVNERGPIGYNDRNGPFFKAGIYRHASPECPLVVLMDDFDFRDELAEASP